MTDEKKWCKTCGLVEEHDECPTCGAAALADHAPMTEEDWRAAEAKTPHSLRVDAFGPSDGRRRTGQFRMDEDGNCVELPRVEKRKLTLVGEVRRLTRFDRLRSVNGEDVSEDAVVKTLRKQRARERGLARSRSQQLPDGKHENVVDEWPPTPELVA